MKLSPTLHRIVPIIFDRQEVIKSCNTMLFSLSTLSQLINYIIASHPDQILSLVDIAKSLSGPTQNHQLRTLLDRMELLLDLSRYNWQYKSTSEGTIEFSSEFQE